MINSKALCDLLIYLKAQQVAERMTQPTESPVNRKGRPFGGRPKTKAERQAVKRRRKQAAKARRK